ncbi:MAG: NADH-quinone oxidoreductase subunit NuoE [Rhodobacteraceae bacterium]|nr:NADH-quinone oxidoreductase subunit NuoE [Paracoccaceae bacterium]MBL6639754.1 NADH-quinone oxidoreductase subunit NuoE [Paracoccaceae bacterium]MBL6789555.1 NADH-quinone oxidoreductase subunit NuoE [Paracoccaceae bacterium]MBL6859598.1 NADH-quinone oxidoreductase subunit NuoE [Paracoccaceae bacterium]
MLRRLHPDQPDSFEFTPANKAWAEAQISKYPEGRQASAVIPLLWRAQEQVGWLTRPAIEAVADMLGLAYMRALEVATFYFMFQLQPVGSIAHIQVCGTTSCMICGAEDLISVCREKIASEAHQLSADGKFSWEEVECLGACTNAPMAQIGKDYYENLTADGFAAIIDEMAEGAILLPGPQNGRFSCEPLGGATSLKQYEANRQTHNASAALAVELNDTVKRIDGSEVPLTTPWLGKSRAKTKIAKSSASESLTGIAAKQPRLLKMARKAGSDDLGQIKGIGPKLQALLNAAGIFHFDQISKWTAENVAWADTHFPGFKGCASRDAWPEQAEALSAQNKTKTQTRGTKE